MALGFHSKRAYLVRWSYIICAKSLNIFYILQDGEKSLISYEIWRDDGTFGINGDGVIFVNATVDHEENALYNFVVRNCLKIYLKFKSKIWFKKSNSYNKD